MPSILSVYWKLEVRCPESGIRIITSVLIFKWWPVGDFYFVIHTSEFLCRVCICYRKVRIHTHTHTHLAILKGQQGKSWEYLDIETLPDQSFEKKNSEFLFLP